MGTAPARYRRGLVVGKFCPLHLGHEHVIRTAQAECADVLILSYSVPEYPRCGPPERERWLRARFPAARSVVLDDARLACMCAARGLVARTVPRNDAGEELQREFVAWLCGSVLDFVPDAVFTSELYGDPFARTLARLFGSGRDIVHRLVDLERTAVPASGTLVRSDVHRHRHLLAPEVYADFVQRVCVLGGESSGKTTLAAALAAAMATAWVPEFGRELWERQGGVLAYPDMRRIAQEQVRREDLAARQADTWLVCDTSPLTTLFYSQEMFGQVDPIVESLADRRYTLTVLCEPDFAFVQDGTRRGADFRIRQHSWHVGQLTRRGVPWFRARGTVADRVAGVLAAVSAARGA